MDKRGIFKQGNVSECGDAVSQCALGMSRQVGRSLFLECMVQLPELLEQCTLFRIASHSIEEGMFLAAVEHPVEIGENGLFKCMVCHC